ncbi:GDP-mannose 4,6-dehydratase [bacterium]|nr:GDP-mannose 4,6-dehydratase [bacterium]
MKALITGITGQDGYYLSKLLLENGYEVHGTIRRSSSFNTGRIDSLISKYSEDEKLNLHFSDLLDASSISNLIDKIEPDEIYNLGAQSHVAVSFSNPLYTSQTSVIGSITLLEAVKNSKRDIKYYQASSSEMFGGVNSSVLDEKSLFYPKSPYAAGKMFAHNMSKIYRESYGIFAANGILFNHESPLRGETFVTRKISKAVGRIAHNLQTKLTLGNLDASRDWGYAGDYVEAMFKIIQHGVADDWVVATGETHTVREFVQKAFRHVNLDWEKFVTTDKKYERPNEVEHLLGDASKIKKKLLWEPKVGFDELVTLMVDSDLKSAEREKTLIEKGLLEPSWEHPTRN